MSPTVDGCAPCARLSSQPQHSGTTIGTTHVWPQLHRHPGMTKIIVTHAELSLIARRAMTAISLAQKRRESRRQGPSELQKNLATPSLLSTRFCVDTARNTARPPSTILITRGRTVRLRYQTKSNLADGEQRHPRTPQTHTATPAPVSVRWAQEALARHTGTSSTLQTTQGTNTCRGPQP